ncbi:hypothetical protein LguiB_030873 [Lonicera macranthoides]
MFRRVAVVLILFILIYILFLYVKVLLSNHNLVPQIRFGPMVFLQIFKCRMVAHRKVKVYNVLQRWTPNVPSWCVL